LHGNRLESRPRNWQSGLRYSRFSPVIPLEFRDYTLK